MQRSLLVSAIVLLGCTSPESESGPDAATDTQSESESEPESGLEASTAPDAGTAPEDATDASLDLPGWTLVFHDEFETLDTASWDIYSGEQGNAPELNKFDPPNVTVSGGQLHLKVEKRTVDGHPYACGGLENPFSMAQTYGRWVVRARFPKGKGYVGYIGLFGQGTGVDYKEIDFGEVSGSFPTSNGFTQHWSTGSSLQHMWEGTDSTAAFHEYTVVWEADALTWLIDGKEEYRVAPSFTPAPMILAMGDWASRCEFTWFGCPDGATPSSDMDVDYVRIYTKK